MDDNNIEEKESNLDDVIEKNSNIVEFKRPDKKFINPDGKTFRAISPLARMSEVSVEYVNVLEDFLSDLLLFLAHRKVSAMEDQTFRDSLILILTYHFLNEISPDGLDHAVLGMPSTNESIGKHILSCQVNHPNKNLYPSPFLHCTFATNDELVKDIFLGQCHYFFNEKISTNMVYQTIEERYNIHFEAD